MSNSFLDSLNFDVDGGIIDAMPSNEAGNPSIDSASTRGAGGYLDPEAAIRRVAQEEGVNPDLLIPLAQLETRLGGATIKGGGQDTNNLFNIKDFSKAGTGIRANDKAEGSNDRYRQYSNFEESARDVIQLLRNSPRYKGALDAQDPTEFATILKNGGYATDPNYVSKFTGVANSRNKPGAQAAKPMRQVTQQASDGGDGGSSSILDQFSNDDVLGMMNGGGNGLMNVPAKQEKSSRSFLDVLGDTVIGVGKIGPTALKGAAEIGNMLTGDSVDLGIASTMQRGMEAMDGFGSERFKADKAGFAGVMQDDTKGIGDMFAYALDNPSILVDNVIPTLGSMFLPAGAAKGAVMGAKAIGVTASTAQKAAVVASIGTGAAQNAAEVFSDLKGRSMEERYAGATISFATSALIGIATGGGADGAIARRMAGDLQAGKIGIEAVKGFLKSIGKETTQETFEETGNIAGKAAGSGKAPTMESAKKQVAFAGALGGIVGGGVHLAIGGHSGHDPQLPATPDNPSPAPAPSGPLTRALDAAGVLPATTDPLTAPASPPADGLTSRASAIEQLLRGDEQTPGLMGKMAELDDDGMGMQGILHLLETAKDPAAPIEARESSLAALEAALQVGATAAHSQGMAADATPSDVPLPPEQTSQADSSAPQAPIYGTEINANRETPQPARVLQPRQRNSAASIQQMKRNASNLDYLQVGPSSVMGVGAPIVFGDLPSSAILGDAQMVTDMDGGHIATRYAIVEAGDVIASNRIDGTSVREYETGAPGKLRTIVGNGRKESIDHAYDIGTAQQKYLPPLLQSTKTVGISAQPQQVEAMRKPMLVRIMDEADVTDNLGAVSNHRLGLESSDAEQAANDARDFDFGEMAFDEHGEPTHDAIRRFIASLPKNDTGNLITSDDRIAPKAIDRMKAATFAHAYEDDALTSEVTMETDPDAKRVLEAAMDAAGVMAALKGKSEFDVSLAVADAIRLAVNAKRNGFELANMAQNQDIAISDEGRAVARMLGSPAIAGSSKRMATALRRWGMLALQQARIAEESQYQSSLVPPATLSREQLFDALGSDSNPTEQAVEGGKLAQERSGAAAPAVQQQASRGGAAPTLPTNLSEAGPTDNLQLNAAGKPFSSEGAAKLALRKFGHGTVVAVEGGGYAIQMQGRMGDPGAVVRGQAGKNGFGPNDVLPKAQPKSEAKQGESTSANTAAPEIGPFGPILRQYRHDAQGAIKALTELQDGEAVAALYHPEVGDIDLVWGREPEGKAQGLGLAKLRAKHPEVLGDLQGFLNRLKKDEARSGPNRVRLVDDGGEAVISLDWKGEQKRWLLTAYEFGAEASTSMDTAGSDFKGDTARLEPSLTDSVPPSPTTDNTRPANWEKSYGPAKAVAESLGIALRNDSGKFKKLPELVTEIKAMDATPALTPYTPTDIEQRQSQQAQATRAEAASQQAQATTAAAEDERKRIAAASVKAADSFELGQDPMDSLTGQKDVFGAMEEATEPPAAPKNLKEGIARAQRNAAQTTQPEATSKTLARSAAEKVLGNRFELSENDKEAKNVSAIAGTKDAYITQDGKELHIVEVVANENLKNATTEAIQEALAKRSPGTDAAKRLQAELDSRGVAKPKPEPRGILKKKAEAEAAKAKALPPALTPAAPIQQETDAADAAPKFSRTDDTETKRQFKETDRAYGGRPAYDKAKAEGKTKLTYDRWVQVRTPNFKAWFGDWEGAHGRAELRGPASILLTGTEVSQRGGDSIDMAAMRDDARSYAAQQVLGRYTNDRSGIAVEVRSIEEALQHRSGPDKIRAIAAIPEIVTGGVVVFDGKNPKRPRERLVILAKKVEIGGQDFFVSAGIRGDANGKLFYDHEMLDVKKAEARLSSQSGTAALPGSTPSSASTHLNDYTLAFMAQVDSTSKAVDPQTGEPLVVYHGTDQSERDGDAFRTFKIAGGAEPGVFFTDDPVTASEYAVRFAEYSEAPSVFPVFLSMPSAKVIEASGKSFSLANKVAFADGNPHGIIIRNVVDGHSGATNVFVAANPTQIKSATGNNGNFDGTNADIRRSGQQSPATPTTPATPIATVRAALTQAYGKLADQLEQRGLVTVVQTQEQAIEAAAQARAAKTGQSVEQAKRELMASVKNSVAPQTESENFKRWFADDGIEDGDGGPEIFVHSGNKDLRVIDPSKGDFGGIFVLPEIDARHASSYHAETYRLAMRGNIATSNELSVFARDNPEIAAKILGKDVESDEYYDALDIVIDESVNDDNAHIIGSFDIADGFAEMQRLRGNLARALGATAVTIEDEFGSSSLLVVNSNNVKDIDRNNGEFDGTNPDIRRSADGNVQGFFDPQSGQAFLVADHLTAEAAPGVLMHEVGIHMAADKTLAPLFNRAKMLLKAQRANAFMQRVQAKMDAAGETSGEEAAAYMVEEYERSRTAAPASVGKWLTDLLASVKAWMHRKGIIGADSLTVADIAAVARANAKSLAQGQAGQGGVKFSRSMREGLAGWTSQRIDDLLGRYAYTMDEGRTKAYAARVSPAAFLDAATPTAEREQLEGEVSPLDASQLADETQPIQLEVVEDGEEGSYRIVGHEGRHRMAALRNAGIDSVPVVIVMRDGPIDNASTIDGPYFAAQKFSDGTRAKRGFEINEMVPINHAYADQLAADFGQSSAEIRFSRTPQWQAPQERAEPAPATWQSPETGKWDEAAYNIQDRHIDTKRVQQAITKSSGPIVDDMNVRQREELFHGRNANAVEIFQKTEVDPLKQQLRKDKIELESFEEYLHARHAPEANAIMAERNPSQAMINAGRAQAAQEIGKLAQQAQAPGLTTVQKKILSKALANSIRDLNRWNKVTAYSGTEESRLMLSGMSDLQAQAIMAGLTPEARAGMARSAALLDAIVTKNRQAMVDNELESQATIDGWANLFQHYVPLMREEVEGFGLHGGLGTGQGFSIKGREVKSRTGSASRKVVDIVANLVAQRERTIERGEKRRVAITLMNLAEANPNPDFWQVGAPDKVQQYDPATRTVKWVTDPQYKSREDVVVAKKLDAQGNIEEVALTFNDKNPQALRMAAAMKNLDDASLNKLLQIVAPATRMMAALSTIYNPMWGIFNFARDTFGAMVSLGSTPLHGQGARRKIYFEAISMLPALIRDGRMVRSGGTNTSASSALFHEFSAVGGATGFRDMIRTSNERSDRLKASIDPDAWMETGWGKVATLGGTIKPLTGGVKQAAEWVLGGISDLNMALENATRISVYKASLETGLSKERSASIAKNITVNFNRRGAIGSQVGAAFAFFNASVQGNVRIAEALTVMKTPGDPRTIRLTEFGRNVVLGSLAIGAIQAIMLAAAGFGPDEPPEHVKDRNITIPTDWTGIGPDKGYVNIPMPLGYNVLPAFGRRLVEFAMGGGKDVFKHLSGITGLILNSANPIGSGTFLQTITPTVLDPIVSAIENVDSFGKPIARVSLDRNVPGHQLSKGSATGLSKWASEKINAISGGDKYTRGQYSPSPDQLDYAVVQYGGGISRELVKIWESAGNFARGEDVPLHKIPLIGRLGGKSSGQAAESTAYYANLSRIDKIEKRIDGLREDGRIAESNAERRNAGPYLLAQARTAEREIKLLRKVKEKAVESGNREAVTRTETRITAAMRRVNDAMAKSQRPRV